MASFYIKITNKTILKWCEIGYNPEKKTLQTNAMKQKQRKDGKIANEAGISVYSIFIYAEYRYVWSTKIVCKLVRQEEGVSSDFCT